jgi:hypothetical protein
LQPQNLSKVAFRADEKISLYAAVSGLTSLHIAFYHPHRRDEEKFARERSLSQGIRKESSYRFYLPIVAAGKFREVYIRASKGRGR